MKDETLLKKMITCLVAGLVLAALWLCLGNGAVDATLPPAVIFSLVGLSLAFSLFFPYVWQYKQNTWSINSLKVYGVLYAVIRYSIAFDLASFAWKKLLGLQFNVPAGIASQPMNKQTGEWLTWFYFGYSHTFVLIVAFIQIAGAVMIMFRRYMLLGAFILFAVMLNLTLINIFYQLNPGATTQAIIMTIGVLFLILLEYNRLVEFFLAAKPTLPSITVNNIVVKNILRFSVIILSLLFTIYLRWNL